MGKKGENPSSLLIGGDLRISTEKDNKWVKGNSVYIVVWTVVMLWAVPASALFPTFPYGFAEASGLVLEIVQSKVNYPWNIFI